MKRRILPFIMATLMAVTCCAGCSININMGTPATESEQHKESQSGENNKDTSKENIDKSEDEKLDKETEKQDEPVKEDEDKKEETANVSSEWTDYEFEVNGETLSLPCSYEELNAATGWEMKSSDEKSYLEDGYYTIVNLYNADEKLCASVEITNTSGVEKLYTDCLITELTQSEYNVNDYDAAPITFPGGLVAGDEVTIEDLIDLFGEPTRTHEYTSEESDYWSNTYTWAEDDTWTTTNNMVINIKNGYIEKISLNCME